MFIQVIQGKAGDAAALRRNMDRWTAELMPGAAGFLGSTAGFTEDGTFIALARFESEEAAQANSDRPEQGAWWAETEKCFDGEVTFLNCTNVQQMLAGGSDEAGFVQIMKGHSDDVARMHELFLRHSADLKQGRPEVIGGLFTELDDGGYVDVMYFESEAAAREGEQKEMPSEVRADVEEGMRLQGDVTYFDLHEPILISP
jgi:hypothetical protein